MHAGLEAGCFSSRTANFTIELNGCMQGLGRTHGLHDALAAGFGMQVRTDATPERAQPTAHTAAITCILLVSRYTAIGFFFSSRPNLGTWCSYRSISDNMFDLTNGGKMIGRKVFVGI